MPNDLTKAEKKLCRELIEKGLQQEFEKAIRDVDAALENWKSKKTDNRDTYHAIFKAVKENDKHIARRYDGIGGSRYLSTVGYLAADGLITQDDIAGFSEESKAYLNRLLSL